MWKELMYQIIHIIIFKIIFKIKIISKIMTNLISINKNKIKILKLIKRLFLKMNNKMKIKSNIYLIIFSRLT